MSIPLPLDQARCQGRIGIEVDAPPCPHSENCLRFAALDHLDVEAGILHYFRIPVITGMDNCELYRPLPAGACKNAKTNQAA